MKIRVQQHEVDNGDEAEINKKGNEKMTKIKNMD